MANSTENFIVDFFDELSKESPDMNKLEDIIKKHPNLFDDKNFHPSSKGQDKRSIGNQTLCGTIKKAKVIAQMHKNGKISSEQFEKFSSITDDKGDNITTKVAYNAQKAKEFMEQSIKEGKNKIANKYKNSLSYYNDILDSLSEIGYSFDIKNAHGKSANDLYKREQAPKTNVLQNQDTPNKPKDNSLLNVIEDNNVTTVGGIQDNEPLTVTEKKDGQNKTDEDENIDSLENPPEEDKIRNKGNFKLNLGKAKDIMEYMYEEWFLASITCCIEYAVNTFIEGPINNLIDNSKKRCEKRKNSLKKQPPSKLKNAQITASNVGTVLANRTNAFDSWQNRLIQTNDDLVNNIGKNPANWKVIDPKNPRDQQLIKQMTDLKANNPKAFEYIKSGDYSSSVAFYTSISKLADTIASTYVTNDYLKSPDLANPDKDNSAKISEKMDGYKKDVMKNLIEGFKALDASTRTRCQTEGITDEKEISQKVAKEKAAYINRFITKTQQVIKAQQNDIDNGNFRGEKGKGVIRESDKLFEDLKKNIEAAPHFGAIANAIYANKAREEMATMKSMGLDIAPIKLNEYQAKTAPILLSMNTMLSTQMANEADFKQRKALLNERKALLPIFSQKYHNPTTNIVTNDRGRNSGR